MLVTLNSKLKAFTLIYVYLVLHTCRLGLSYKIWGPVIVPSAKAHQFSTVYPICCTCYLYHDDYCVLTLQIFVHHEDYCVLTLQIFVHHDGKIIVYSRFRSLSTMMIIVYSRFRSLSTMMGQLLCTHASDLCPP